MMKSFTGPKRTKKCTVTTSRRISWKNKIRITDSEHTYSTRTSLMEMPPWSSVTWPWLMRALTPATWEQHNTQQKWKCSYTWEVSKTSKILGLHPCKWDGTNSFSCVVSPMESKSSNPAEHLLVLMVSWSNFFSLVKRCNMGWKITVQHLFS